MFKLRSINQPSISYASTTKLKPVNRLIVLVPSPDADLTAVTGRVWELASKTGAEVRFLGLCSDAAQGPSLRRALITQSALVNSSGVIADTEIIVGKDSIHAVTSLVQPGDMFVCWNEPTGFLPRKVNMILEANPDTPVYLLSGHRPKGISGSHWLPGAAAWMGSLAIILAFFWFQVEIDHIAKGLTISLQAISVALEFWLLVAWNNRLA